MILRQKAVLVPMLSVEYQVDWPASRAIVAAASAFASGHIIGPLMEYVCERLATPGLTGVTKEDLAVWATPEGKLYNQQIVDDAYEDKINTQNVKKSNKVYSHEDQIAMLEEKKKELEKKRKEGKLELTQKQKEIQKQQLEKESKTRAKIQVCIDEHTRCD